MEKTDIWKIALILVMMILSALFSGTETAYSSVNKLRLKKTMRRRAAKKPPKPLNSPTALTKC